MFPSLAARVWRAPIRVSSLRTALLVVWIAGTVDLYLTHCETANPAFIELNPIANEIVDKPLVLLAAYKYTLLAAATAILVALRATRACQWGSWVLIGSHSALMAYWCFYLAVRGPLQPVG
ncbi:MAG: DUF5658 family protein [Phycisphaerae bacterium]|nr:DUF5658 family protein [Phycisphaerae bacterium]